MVHANNYETASKFVKGMPRILWPLFSGHDVLCYVKTSTAVAYGKRGGFQISETFTCHKSLTSTTVGVLGL